jgi:hypothetical protein
MGLKLPRELRQWLLANDIRAGRQPDADSCLVALGCGGVIPSGGLLLGLTDIKRVYLHKLGMEEMEPSGDPDCPSWSEGSNPEERKFTSLFAFFQDVADHLEGVSSGNARETAGVRIHDRDPEGEAIRLWARANGYLVSDRGRIPASIREAYEASR